MSRARDAWGFPPLLTLARRAAVESQSLSLPIIGLGWTLPPSSISSAAAPPKAILKPVFDFGRLLCCSVSVSSADDGRALCSDQRPRFDHFAPKSMVLTLVKAMATASPPHLEKFNQALLAEEEEEEEEEENDAGSMQRTRKKEEFSSSSSSSLSSSDRRGEGEVKYDGRAEFVAYGWSTGWQFVRSMLTNELTRVLELYVAPRFVSREVLDKLTKDSYKALKRMHAAGVDQRGAAAAIIRTTSWGGVLYSSASVIIDMCREAYTLFHATGRWALPRDPAWKRRLARRFAYYFYVHFASLGLGAVGTGFVTLLLGPSQPGLAIQGGGSIFAFGADALLSLPKLLRDRELPPFPPLPPSPPQQQKRLGPGRR